MFDARLRPIIDPALEKIARRLSGAGLSADQASLAGAVSGLLAGASIAAGFYLAGFAFFALSRLLDGLDGALARLSGATDWGGYLDIVCDFVVYVSVPVGFGLADPDNLLPALALTASFTLTGATFLAFAVLAEKQRGQPDRGQKSFVYSAGLAEGTETIVVFSAACLFPGTFPVLAVLFAGLCVITAVQRSLDAWAHFGGRRGGA